MEISIPFSGFYCTYHDASLDNEVEKIFFDPSGDPYPWSDALQSHYDNGCKWAAVYAQYAKHYVEKFAEEHAIALEYATTDSPREYNFTTDRPFAEITEAEARRILALVKPEDLQAMATEHMTSRSGFRSFYEPDVTTWGDLATWDHNQLNMILRALVGPGFGQDEEFDLMESARCNGMLGNWLDAATPGADRLWSVHEYLEKRRTRQLEKTL